MGTSGFPRGSSIVVGLGRFEALKFEGHPVDELQEAGGVERFSPGIPPLSVSYQGEAGSAHVGPRESGPHLYKGSKVLYKWASRVSVSSFGNVCHLCAIMKVCLP